MKRVQTILLIQKHPFLLLCSSEGVLLIIMLQLITILVKKLPIKHHQVFAIINFFLNLLHSTSLAFLNIINLILTKKKSFQFLFYLFHNYLIFFSSYSHHSEVILMFQIIPILHEKNYNQIFCWFIFLIIFFLL